MDYFVPLLAVFVIGAITFVVAGRLGRRSRPQAPGSALPHEIGAPRAQEAAALLDEPAHRAVYGAIAQGDVMGAVRAYRRHTGRSLRDTVVDVQSLAAHPQIWRPAGLEEPQEGAVEASSASGAVEPERPGHDAGRATPVDADPVPSEAAPETPRPRDGADVVEDAEPLTIPADWTAAPAPEIAPFDVEVERGEERVRVSSRDLPAWLRDQLAAMVRDGNLESAAVQLAGHSDLTVPEAFELLRRLREDRGGR